MKEKIISILKQELKENQDQLNAHNKLKEILRPFEGKRYDGRLQKKLPEGYKIERTGVYHFASIKIKSPEGREHFVGYNNDPVVSIEQFERNDAPYFSGAKERIKKMEAILNDPEKLAQCVATFETLYTAWDAFSKAAKEIRRGNFDSYNCPAHYELLRMCNVDSKILLDF